MLERSPKVELRTVPCVTHNRHQCGICFTDARICVICRQPLRRDHVEKTMDSVHYRCYREYRDQLA